MGGMIVQEITKIVGDRVNKLICFATGSIGDIPGRFETMDETREKLLGIETLLSGDKYSFVKDAYIQSMYYEIKDGIDVEDEFIDDMDDFLIDE
jgi:ABC-type transporter lipoprotein component MlaA